MSSIEPFELLAQKGQSSSLPTSRRNASRYFSRVSRHHLVWQRRYRRLLVPVDLFEVVADELLVEADLRASRRVLVLRPVSGRVGRHHLIDEQNVAFGRQSELELRIGQQHAAALGVGRAERVER